MQELTFHVQGSDVEPYEVRIVHREDGKLSAYCTCQAGSNGMHCKHRIGILTGNAENLVDAKKLTTELQTVCTWFQGSDIETALNELRKAERELEAIKATVSRLKKTLAKAMLD
jgi:uncharacterized Zn finger protein